MQAMPAQLVFGRDAVLKIMFDADWKSIRERKQHAININNQRENAKHISHTYKVGDLVLYQNDFLAKFNQDPYDGPYRIVHTNTNGTVRLKMGAVTDTVNLRLIKPYRQ